MLAHTITLGDILKVGGIALAIIIPLGIIAWLLSIYGQGMSR
jgi:hypothetical protein